MVLKDVSIIRYTLHCYLRILSQISIKAREWHSTFRLRKLIIIHCLGKCISSFKRVLRCQNDCNPNYVHENIEYSNYQSPIKFTTFKTQLIIVFVELQTFELTNTNSKFTSDISFLCLYPIKYGGFWYYVYVTL